MPQCVVKGCQSGSRRCRSIGIKIHLFCVPKDDELRQKWQDAIQRNDIVLGKNHRVCQKHFRSEEIRWHKVLTDSLGNVVGISAKYLIPRLHEGAIPSLFEWTPIAEDGLPETSVNKELTEDSVSSFNVTDMSTLEPSLAGDTSDTPINPIPDNEVLVPNIVTYFIKEPKYIIESDEPDNVSSNPTAPVETLKNYETKQEPTDVRESSIASFSPVSDGENAAIDKANNSEDELMTSVGDGQLDASFTSVSDSEIDSNVNMSVDGEETEAPEKVNVSVDGEETEAPQKVVSLFLGNLKETDVVLPHSWSMHKRIFQGVTVVFFVKLVPTIIANGKIVLNNCQEVTFTESVNGDISLDITIVGRSLTETATELLGINKKITSSTEITDILRKVHSTKVCGGYFVQSASIFVDPRLAFQDKAGIWRHKQCSLLSETKTCVFCTRMRKTLLQRAARAKAKSGDGAEIAMDKETESILRLRKQAKSALRGKQRALKVVQELRMNLKEKEKEIEGLSMKRLDALLIDNQISANECTVIKAIINAAECKNKNGRRYSDDWILLCMLLFKGSARGYRVLRQYNVLPLPNIRTIRRYFASISNNKSENVCDTTTEQAACTEIISK